MELPGGDEDEEARVLPTLLLPLVNGDITLLLVLPVLPTLLPAYTDGVYVELDLGVMTGAAGGAYPVGRRVVGVGMPRGDLSLLAE